MTAPRYRSVAHSVDEAALVYGMNVDRKYSISLEAHGDRQGDDALPKISAVMQVDRDGNPQITELTVGAADGGPIPPAVARNIDFAMLADALNRAVSATLRRVPDGPDDGPVPPHESPAPAPVAVTPHANGTANGTSHGTSYGTSDVQRSATKERPYRRMPDQDEVTAVMQRVRSVGKLAEHYDVPRYTAQAWVDRLRKAGLLD